MGSAGTAPEDHVQLLQKFLAVLLHVLPPAEITRPALLHQDLHADNILVDKDDPTKISSIIDWQALYAAPFFLQAKFASVVDCDDPYRGVRYSQSFLKVSTIFLSRRKL